MFKPATLHIKRSIPRNRLNYINTTPILSLSRTISSNPTPISPLQNYQSQSKNICYNTTATTSCTFKPQQQQRFSNLAAFALAQKKLASFKAIQIPDVVDEDSHWNRTYKTTSKTTFKTTQSTSTGESGKLLHFFFHTFFGQLLFALLLFVAIPSMIADSALNISARKHENREIYYPSRTFTIPITDEEWNDEYEKYSEFTGNYVSFAAFKKIYFISAIAKISPTSMAVGASVIAALIQTAPWNFVTIAVISIVALQQSLKRSHSNHLMDYEHSFMHHFNHV